MSNPTTTAHSTSGDIGLPARRPSESVRPIPPGEYESLIDWGLASVEALREHVAQVWLMTRSERLAAYVRGELTPEQIQEWTGRAPREVPLINGEFGHIAASTPEACFRCQVCGDDEVMLAAGGVLAHHRDYRHPDWGKPTGSASGAVPVCSGSGAPVRHANADSTTRRGQSIVARGRVS